jgi:hypothetical protein
MFLGSKVRLVRKNDNLATICELFVYDNVGSLTSHNPIDLKGPVQGELFFFFALRPLSQKTAVAQSV